MQKWYDLPDTDQDTRTAVPPSLGLVTFKVEAPKPILEQCIYTSSHSTWSMEITKFANFRGVLVLFTNLSTFGNLFVVSLRRRTQTGLEQYQNLQKHLNTTNPLQEISPNHPPVTEKNTHQQICALKSLHPFLGFLLGGKR